MSFLGKPERFNRSHSDALSPLSRTSILRLALSRHTSIGEIGRCNHARLFESLAIEFQHADRLLLREVLQFVGGSWR